MIISMLNKTIRTRFDQFWEGAIFCIFSKISALNESNNKLLASSKMSESMSATASSSCAEEQPATMGEANSPQFSDEVLQREIPCETQDGDRVPVRVSLLLQSKTFGTMWKDLNMPDAFSFPVKGFSTKVFNKIVLWLHEHVGKPEPVIEEDPDTHVRKLFTMSEWELNFYKVELSELAELLRAANYLNIPSLYYSGCQAMATLLQEKDPEQTREMLGLEDDLSDEEKAELRRKSVWCNY